MIHRDGKRSISSLWWRDANSLWGGVGGGGGGGGGGLTIFLVAPQISQESKDGDSSLVLKSKHHLLMTSNHERVYKDELLSYWIFFFHISIIRKPYWFETLQNKQRVVPNCVV